MRLRETLNQAIFVFPLAMKTAVINSPQLIVQVCSVPSYNRHCERQESFLPFFYHSAND
jgi:hypothetical protein